MAENRLTENRHPRPARIDRLSSPEIADFINAEDLMVAQAVGSEEANALLLEARGSVARVVGEASRAGPAIFHWENP